MNNSDINVTLFSPTLVGGGAEKVFVNLANELYRQGCVVTLLLCQKVGVNLKDVAMGVRVVVLDVARIRWSLYPLCQYLKKEKVDILITAHNFPLLHACVSRWLISGTFKVIATVHFNPADKISQEGFFERLYGVFMASILNRTNAVVGVSDSVCNALLNKGVRSELLRRIYNPVLDVEYKSKMEEPLTDSWLMQSTEPVVVSIGRLEKVKAYEDIIVAVGMLQKKIKCRLLILGDGREYDALVALVDTLALKNRVKIIGYQDNVYKYLKRASVFVLASKSEGFSNVVVEALAVGLPMVVTKSGGPEEILDNGRYGAMVNVGDVEGLSCALYDSLTGQIKTECGKERALDFCVSNVTNRYIDLMRELVCDGTK